MKKDNKKKKKDISIEDVFEIVTFLKDNMPMKSEVPSKEEFNEVKRDVKRLDKKIDNVKNEMIEHVDGFIALYQKHEVELAAVVSRQSRFERKLDMVIAHLGLESEVV